MSFSDREEPDTQLSKRDPAVRLEEDDSFDEVPDINDASLENFMVDYLTYDSSAGGGGGEEDEEMENTAAAQKRRRQEAIISKLRTNRIYQARNRQGAARAILERVNESYKLREPLESRRFDSLATEARLWRLMRELGVRELTQFEAATSFDPQGRDMEPEEDVMALKKWVQDDVINAILRQEEEDRQGSGRGRKYEKGSGPGNAQYLREMCAAKAPFILNDFYDHMGGINMRGRAQQTGGFTNDELKRNNRMELVYTGDGGSKYAIHADTFPRAAQKLFSTLRKTK